jgi:DNA-directed RNA polymerase specialized sigma24 family protein
MPSESDEGAKQAPAPIAYAPQLPDSTAQASTDAENTSQLDVELDAWRRMDNSRRCAELRAVIQGEQTVRIEILVHECTRAREERNPQLLGLAFNALSTRAAAGGSDPLLDIPMRGSSTEALALLECAEDRLPDELRRVFIQYHRLGMTHEEIAQQHGVSARSIYSRIKKAEAAIGYSGETHGR